MRKIGIDIGGTKMLGVVVESHDETHGIVDEVRVAAPVSGDREVRTGAWLLSRSKPR